MNFWVKGYVVCELFGGTHERFLNDTQRQHIALQRVSTDNTRLRFTVAAEQYKHLRALRRHSGGRLKVVRKRGLPFRMKAIRGRWGLAAGFTLSLILLYSLSARMWAVEVSGNAGVTNEEILQLVAPLGVQVGARFDRVNIEQVQFAALKANPKIGWLTVNQHGCIAEILVKEKPITTPPRDTAPADVVSRFDGEILQLVVTDGQPLVKVGDTVTAGQIIIAGITETELGQIRRRASGTVTARVTLTHTVTVPLCETVKQTVAEGQQPTLLFFHLKIPLYTKKQNLPNGQIQQSLWRVNGRDLPIGIQHTVTQKTVSINKQRTQEEAIEEAQRRLSVFLREQAVDMTVESADVQVTQSDTAVTVTGTYTGVRQIGEIRAIS